MKSFITLLALTFTSLVFGQNDNYLRSDLVNFDDYLALANEVKLYREDRLVSLTTFNNLASQPNVVILDTRSDSMYQAKHVKGAIHLNFSDFTVATLSKLIPDPNTVILIYCNNNFLTNIPLRIEDQYFMSKSAPPTSSRIPSFTGRTGSKANADNEEEVKKTKPIVVGDTKKEEVEINPALLPVDSKPITLALNIPTFINLYGYGYRNIYELGELVSTSDPRIQFEGTAVPK